MDKLKRVGLALVLFVLLAFCIFNLGSGLAQDRLYVGRRVAKEGWIDSQHPNFHSYLIYNALAIPVILGLAYWKFRPAKTARKIGDNAS